MDEEVAAEKKAEDTFLGRLTQGGSFVATAGLHDAIPLGLSSWHRRRNFLRRLTQGGSAFALGYNYSAPMELPVCRWTKDDFATRDLMAAGDKTVETGWGFWRAVVPSMKDVPSNPK